MTDQPQSSGPSALREMSEVESPEVVRAALRRFRRRTLTWSFWVLLAILAGIALLVLPRPFLTQSLQERFAHSPSAEIGRRMQSGLVEVILMDARQLDRGQVGLHVLLLAADLGPDEDLWAGPPLSEFGVESYRPGEPMREITSRGKGSVEELWIALPAKDKSVRFDVAAVKEARLGSASPGDECVVPTNGENSCPLFADEGRLLTSVTLELADLGIPEWIWKETA